MFQNMLTYFCPYKQGVFHAADVRLVAHLRLRSSRGHDTGSRQVRKSPTAPSVTASMAELVTPVTPVTPDPQRADKGCGLLRAASLSHLSSPLLSDHDILTCSELRSLSFVLGVSSRLRLCYNTSTQCCGQGARSLHFSMSDWLSHTVRIRTSSSRPLMARDPLK